MGAIQAGALEDSNVELSDQLVNLIVAQRNYQANAKTIETESAITQTILNLRSVSLIFLPTKNALFSAFFVCGSLLLLNTFNAFDHNWIDGDILMHAVAAGFDLSNLINNIHAADNFSKYRVAKIAAAVV